MIQTDKYFLDLRRDEGSDIPEVYGDAEHIHQISKQEYYFIKKNHRIPKDSLLPKSNEIRSAILKQVVTIQDVITINE